MNKKGQALVEFVIIIPIIIMICFSMFDLGLILYNKNNLENKLNDVISMVNNNESESEINKYINYDTKLKTTYKIVNKEYKELILYREYKSITPGLNKVLDDPYKIEVSRVMYEK